MSLYTAYWTHPEHLLGAAIGLSVLDVAVVAVRFWARRRQRQPIKWDDWFMIPAAAGTVVIGIIMVIGVSEHTLGYEFVIPEEANGNGLMVDTWQISLEGKLQWAYIMVLPVALGCSKASLLFLYRRIFVVQKRGLTNILIFGLIVLDLLWMVAFFLAGLFECGTEFWAVQTYLQAFLDNCIDDTILSLASAVSDLILDIIILVLPLPLIWRLNLNKYKKIAISAVFLLGLGSVAASITRVIMTGKINAEGYGPEIDAMLLVSSFIYWGHVEAAIAVVVACLPALWHLVKDWPWKPAIRALSSGGIGTSMRTRTSRRSRHSILIDEEEGTTSMSVVNIRSAGSETAIYNAVGEGLEAHPLNGIKVERAYRVERG